MPGLPPSPVPLRETILEVGRMFRDSPAAREIWQGFALQVKARKAHLSDVAVEGGALVARPSAALLRTRDAMRAVAA